MELDVVGKIIELSWELELASKSPWIWKVYHECRVVFVTRESMDFSYLFWFPDGFFLPRVFTGKMG
jgi:hypothetical protein